MSTQLNVKAILEAANELLDEHDAFIEYVVVNAPSDEDEVDEDLDDVQEEAEALNRVYDSIVGKEPNKTEPVKKEHKQEPLGDIWTRVNTMEAALHDVLHALTSINQKLGAK